MLVLLHCSGANELDIGGNNDLDVCLELSEIGESKEERGQHSHSQTAAVLRQIAVLAGKLLHWLVGWNVHLSPQLPVTCCYRL
jgi:hypothetical protein